MTDSREKDMPETIWAYHHDLEDGIVCASLEKSHNSKAQYTHTARLLAQVKKMRKKYPRTLIGDRVDDIHGYNAALLDVEKLLTQKD